MSTLSPVELGVLGPLQVRQFGLPVPIPGAKPRALLTMLGLHSGAVVPASTLVELLWGDDPPRTAPKALQTHISGLRRALGEGFVLTQGSGWTLGSADVDAARYTAAATLGRQAMTSDDVGRAVSCFDEALSLWRGMPELPAGRRGDAERIRWDEDHAALVEDRADAQLAAGRAAELIGELEAAIAVAPLRERRWGQLMLALYRAGRQGEALAAFQRVRTLLATELGIEPGPELRRLENKIVSQDISLDVAVEQRFPVVTRAVTFLLTDIEGSTAAWEADAPGMAAALARHDEMVERIVTFSGGRLIKTRGEGDATFSVFDRPSAAAAAAIALQDAVSSEAWTLARPMRIRIALHTGEAEFRDGDYFGRAVNRAARLRSLAAGGQTLCSGATAELVIDSLGEDVVLTDLGTRTLKNLARPEHVFELCRTTADDVPVAAHAEPLNRPAIPPALAGTGPFVGRGGELERLSLVWQTVVAEGVRAALIAGEPGVGKTRLAGEWARHAYGTGAVIVYGRCDEDLGAPYQPFAEALRALVSCLGSERMSTVRGVESLLPLVPGLADLLPGMTEAPRADPDTERYALFDAVVAVLNLAAADAPIVIVLDDLHWAATSTLLLLRHLLRFGDGARLHIVGTYRNTDLDRTHPLAAMLADLHRDGHADRLTLDGLDEGDVTAYVAESGYDDEELARALASVTGGNPFFLIEALRHVGESGGHWDAGTLPQGVREAVSRRLSRLPEATNTALAAAAVVGSVFSVDLVERVTEHDLVDAFDEAARAGLLIEEAGGRYRFNHALVRQSLLAELPSVRRMRLHQKIGSALEAQPNAGDDLLAELAYHYFECAWAGNALKAVEYCRRAADQAMARLAYENAADLYDKALHALDELDDEPADMIEQHSELLIARCEALLAAGDVGSAASAVAQLRSSASASDRLRAWGACFVGQLTMLTEPERLDQIEREVADAAAVLAGVGDAAGEAKAHTVRATCLGRLGRVGDCEAALDRALTAARRARDDRRVNAVLAGAPLAALWGPSPVPRAGGRCLDVVRLLRITTGSPIVEAASTRCQGVLDALRGRTAAARALIDSARRSLDELGMRHAVLEVEQFAGIAELIVGDAAAAQPHLRNAYRGFRRMRLDADTAETAALLARACLALGQEGDADRLCSESERLAGHALKASIAWRTVRAQLLVRGGDSGNARRVAEEAVALAERTDALVDHGDACLALAAVLDAAGDASGARVAAERAVDLYQLKGASALVDQARALLGQEPSVRSSDPAVLGPDGEGEVVRSLPSSENAAIRCYTRFNARMVAGDRIGLAQTMADDFVADDRRRVVGSGRGGRDAALAHVGVITDLGVTHSDCIVLATRGNRLALLRARFGGRDVQPDAFFIDVLHLVEVSEASELTGFVAFDVDDLDAAITELDARYTAGEAARFAQAWSAIAEAYAAFNRREIAPTSEGWVSIDHRRGSAFAPGDMVAYLSAAWADSPDTRIYVDAVQRLSDTGAVVTHSARGLTHNGFEAEWRDVNLLTLDGDLITGTELFDADDLDTAIKRFDRLDRDARGSGSTKNHWVERFRQGFLDRDWQAIRAMLTDDFFLDDRRRTVNGGSHTGPDAEILELKAAADVGFTDVDWIEICSRGSNLALMRVTWSGLDQGSGAFDAEWLGVAQWTADEQLAGVVMLNVDDFDAAIAELDARYLAGGAAPFAPTFSAVVQAFSALNAREVPPMTANFVDIDHRNVGVIGSGDLKAYIAVALQDIQNYLCYVEAVHRLSEHGSVITQVAEGFSSDERCFEWRIVDLLTFDGDLITRCEMFDESDLDAAVARFDEIERSAVPCHRASQVAARFRAAFAARDWQAAADLLSVDLHNEDRRSVVNAGVRHGPESMLADLRAVADMGIPALESVDIATRGESLVLVQAVAPYSKQPSAFHVDNLVVAEIGTDGRISAQVIFDPDDLDAAFAELDARYMAGEGASHGHIWSLVIQIYAAFNRHELFALAPGWVNVDHRRGVGSGTGEIDHHVSELWKLVPDIKSRIEAVHRLSDLGAVITHAECGTTREEFSAEWREVALLMFDGNAISRCEIYDERDLADALAHFDELNLAGQHNSASLMNSRLVEAFNDRDAADYFACQAADARFHDRRRGLMWEGPNDTVFAHSLMSQAPDSWVLETETIDVRGDDRVLVRYAFRDTAEPSRPVTVEALALVEVNGDELVIRSVLFDVDSEAEARSAMDRD